VNALLRRMPLRVRLVLVSAVLLAVGLALSGAVAATTLRGYLVQRVDDQLGTVAGQPFLDAGGGPGAGPDGDRDGDRRGPSEFFVATLDADGTVTSLQTRPFDAGTTAPDLSGLDATAARAHGSRPFTVGSDTGSGPHWRVLARQVGGSGSTVVVAHDLADVDHTVGRLALLELVIGLSVVLLLAGVGYALVRRSLRPLTEGEATAAAIAAGDLSRRVPEADARTEVGRLSEALNGMLHRIESAFRVQQESEATARRSEEQMRRFVADASHELRTPLTSIRGFAELFRQGAVADEGELRRVLRRIEDEATRMGVLVDDLLLLARLDQQRPLERRTVDLTALAADAVDDARVVAPDRPVELVTGPGSPVVVIGDELRLRQVVGNLVGNALTHTPPATPVTVRVGRDTVTSGPRAVLEVADAGPGLSAEEADRVFERFYRADASRTRSHGGTGLGLSIVASLAAAHGGSVELDSAPGQGATFRVALPLAPGTGTDGDVAG
jgi:two-component system, OmpR family, sensor kinase